jgi:hypothetical protein
MATGAFTFKNIARGREPGACLIRHRDRFDRIKNLSVVRKRIGNLKLQAPRLHQGRCNEVGKRT